MYPLDVTPADDNATVVAQFEADLSGLAGGSAVVFASGFLDPASNEGAKGFGLFAALATGDVVEFTKIITYDPGPWMDMGVCSDWKYDAVFEDGTDQTHGVAVDGEGKIWMGSYGKIGIIVRYANGDSADFSPLNTVTIDGEEINLADGNCRGMATDKDGNILYAKGADLLKINSMTGEGMAKWTGPGSLLAPSVDDEGFIYVGKVVGISPIAVIDPATFELTQEIELEGTASYARGAVVTPDGKGIWAGDLGGSGGPIYNWTSEDLVTYTKTDSIFANTDGKPIFTTQRTTMDWGPDGTLWVSHDNAYAAGDNTPNGLFVFDFNKMGYCFLPSPEVEPGIGNGPRGVAFSASGDTAYSISFNANKVWRFVREAKTRLQVIHNAADNDLATVDVYVNDALTLDNFAFRKATELMEVAPGDMNIKITPSGAVPGDSIIAEFDVTLDAGMNYVAIANGIAEMNSEKYVNPDPAARDIMFTLFPIGDVREAATDPTLVEFFAFHGVTDAPAVDVLAGGLPLVNDLDYGMNTPYVGVPPDVYELDVTPGDDNATVVASFEADLSGLAGGAAVVFASGFLDPTANEGGKAFGLFAALPTGDVVEFPNITKLPPGPWTNMGECTEWTYDGMFEDSTNQTHGVAIDGEGKVWMGSYGKVGIIVKYGNGQYADFSPLEMVTIDGEDIDLTAGNCRGMATDKDGNILYAKGADLLRINSMTGEGMDKWVGPGSLLAPSVDDEGFIYVGKVVGVSPIAVIDPVTFELTQEIELAGAASYARGAVVTPDGKGIWAGDLGGSGGPLYNWTSEDLVTYTKTDSIFANTDGEQIFTTQRTTMDWGPGGTMWVSHDNAYAAGDNSPNGLFRFDFDKMEYCFLAMPDLVPGVGNGPRGVAFNATGDTAYVVSFNANAVWRFVKGFVDVDPDPVAQIPTSYDLGQNYPNPFNPSTLIPFSIVNDGKVELKVYDILGREVVTLVDRNMTAGTYRVMFDASDLATGCYHYRMKVNGQVFTKQMLLVK
jgi:DNA-binding beta-propeller fold protein YncE